jgi:serine/threonine-protein kinase
MAIIAVVGFWILTLPTPQPLRKLVITPPSTAPLRASGFVDVVISPDGRSIIYPALVSGSRGILFLRSLDDLVATPIPGTEGAGSPFFSPDGKSVAFSVSGKLKKVSLLGGPPTTICDARGFSAYGSWDVENTIVFSALSESGTEILYRVSAMGGEPEILAVPVKGELGYHQPAILPGGRAILFTVLARPDDPSQIAVLSLETGEKKVLLEQGASANYVPTGHLVYVQPDTANLMAVPFDLASLEVIGDPVPVLEGIRGAEGSSDYAISRDGTLVYVPDSVEAEGQRMLVWVDREGRAKSALDVQRNFSNPRLSPDGQRLAIQIFPSTDVWVYEIARGILTPLTLGTAITRSPIWTPDGSRLTYSVAESGIFWIPADGSGTPDQLTKSQSLQMPNSWSPDGALAYSEGLPVSGDIWVLPLEGDRQPQEFLVTEFNERHPMFSPNGGWIAFTSDRSGRDEVYVKPYPGEGGIVPISSTGGIQPLWARSGKELFYRNGDKMMVVSVQMEPVFRVETPQLLFEGTFIIRVFDWASNYDISRDDEEFIMVRQEEAQTQINVVLNWFEELKRLVPTP